MAVVFRSLVATVKLQPALDGNLERKAVKLLESVGSLTRIFADAFLSNFASFADGPLTDFTQSLVVLISSPNQVITVAAMKLLGSLFWNCAENVRLTLVKADLIPQVINSLTPQSLPFPEAVDIHNSLMTIIRNSIWLATPNGLKYLEIEDNDEQQAVHETVLKQVLIPSEEYIWHLCVNRYSIIDDELSKHFLELLVHLLQISPYYQPTMDLILHLPTDSPPLPDTHSDARPTPLLSPTPTPTPDGLPSSPRHPLRRQTDSPPTRQIDSTPLPDTHSDVRSTPLLSPTPPPTPDRLPPLPDTHSDVRSAPLLSPTPTPTPDRLPSSPRHPLRRQTDSPPLPNTHSDARPTPLLSPTPTPTSDRLHSSPRHPLRRQIDSPPLPNTPSDARPTPLLSPTPTPTSDRLPSSPQHPLRRQTDSPPLPDTHSDVRSTPLLSPTPTPTSDRLHSSPRHPLRHQTDSPPLPDTHSDARPTPLLSPTPTPTSDRLPSSPQHPLRRQTDSPPLPDTHSDVRSTPLLSPTPTPTSDRLHSSPRHPLRRQIDSPPLPDTHSDIRPTPLLSPTPTPTSDRPHPVHWVLISSPHQIMIASAMLFLKRIIQHCSDRRRDSGRFGGDSLGDIAHHADLGAKEKDISPMAWRRGPTSIPSAANFIISHRSISAFGGLWETRDLRTLPSKSILSPLNRDYAAILPLPHHPHPPTPLCLFSPPTPSHSPLPLPHHPHPPTPLCLSLTTLTIPLLSASSLTTLGVSRAENRSFEVATFMPITGTERDEEVSRRGSTWTCCKGEVM
ncbi:hypothetical protein BLNAU_10763 [Blattamonas nauphoetae]|uniref:Uncharacterized protein n=1 Tax=Blattamonas nauphoetae TaxID=2049346 RepID=A0ABQ9XSJ3_9EUKA|nr:hypothetical protein BLNAU_10763 [Blattamonas nauphoetae]